MGIIRDGPPWSIIKELLKEYKITEFIETGTYYGGTATRAATYFENVITIENSKKIYDSVIVKYSHIRNIKFLYGDSRSQLKKVVQDLSKPALFWLDGHWSGGNTYGEFDECPLIDEISIINASGCSHFLFIDDARLFLSPPPSPHKISHWPNIVEVIYAINDSENDYYIVIFEDVIIAVPFFVKNFIVNYCMQFNTSMLLKRREQKKISKDIVLGIFKKLFR